MKHLIDSLKLFGLLYVWIACKNDIVFIIGFVLWLHAILEYSDNYILDSKKLF